MAKANTVRGGKFLILIGDNSNPINYTAPCGFNEKSVTFSKGMEEVNIPDCDDPDKVDWIGRDATSLSMSVSGQGLLDVGSLEMWLDAFESIDSVPVKIELLLPNETVRWTGDMHIENLEAGTQNKGRITLNVSMQSDGPMVRTVTPLVPANSVAPSITGTAQVGQTLTANDGTWTGQPAPTLSRQWKANGTNIPGATGVTYTPVSGDIGKTITVTVTGTNTAGNSTATSPATAAVIAA